MTRTFVITGASSGIGRALALHYARDGASLGLTGRDCGRLDAVAGECAKLGATVQTAVLDVRDRAEVARWLAALDRQTPVDLVIANAGLMAGTPPDGEIELADAGYGVVEANVLGVLNTVQPLLGPMMARRRGQIAIVSSLAGLIALPDSPSYCASKSAALAYGRSLRALLAPYNIGVSVICPGYVTTPMMLRETGRKPMTMSAERAAGIIAAGLSRNKAVIAFPALLAFATRLHGFLPEWLQRKILARSRFTVAD
jgi:short-subunit dehydrogenase